VNGITSDYSFEWYEGVSAQGLLISTGQTINDRPSGIYTVKVTDFVSFCQTIVSVEIGDQLTIPEATLQITSNTSCALPANGSVQVTDVREGFASFPLAFYDLEWYEGADPFGPAISFGSFLERVPAGVYSVTVTSHDTGCVGVATAEVSDAPGIPDVTMRSIPNTSCSLFRNGAATAEVGGIASDYSFEWYQGTGAEGQVISTGQTINDRPSGIYTVKVTDFVSFCQVVASTEITDQQTPPAVNIHVSNNNNCLEPDGSLTAMTEGPIFQYEFAWYEGTDTFGPPLSNTNSLSNLAAGTYSVSVTDIYSGCITFATAQVADECQLSPGGFSTFGNDVFNNPKKQETTIAYFPNPATETLWIQSDATVAIALIDHRAGVILREYVYASDTPFALDLSDVRPGKYILTVTGDGKTSSYQIIVKR